MKRLRSVVLLSTAGLCLAWMNPTRDRIAEGNRLFKQGKFGDAITKYGEVLIDNPDSALLNFNMGDANYKAGKYAEALASFARVRTADDPKRAATVDYNAGNAQYRLGAAAEAGKPEDALKAYASALVAYRRALGADPTDRDAKFNYELVSKKIEDLKKKLEEQQKQQEQKKQQEQQQQPEQNQQQQNQQQQDKEQQNQQDQAEQQQQQAQQPDQQQPEQDQHQQQAQPDKSNEPKQQQQAQAAQPSDEPQQQAQQAQAAQEGTSSGEKKDKMSRPEAAALIDTARNDELQPDEFARRVQGGRVAEPAQDW